MAITLVRIDDRIIHGQIMTRWTKARDVHGIIVVGDKVAGDDLRKRVLKAAAGNYPLGIFSEDAAPEKIQQAAESSKSYFVIAESPLVYENLVKKGVNFGDVINVGPMNQKPGSRTLGNTISLDEKDYKAFEYLDEQGYELSFQLIPSDRPRTWETIKERYHSTEER